MVFLAYCDELMKAPWELSGQERKALYFRAVRLARSLVGNEIIARGIANQAMGSLEGQFRVQQERSDVKHKDGTLKRMRLDTPQLLQVLVMVESTRFLDVLVDFTEGDERLGWFYVFYLKLLVQQAMRHNSFEANVAINEFVYYLSPVEIIDFHELLTDSETRFESGVSKRRLKILEMLKRELLERVQIEKGPYKQDRLVADEEIVQFQIQSQIYSILSALVPWDAQCNLPNEVGREGTISKGNRPHFIDLHSNAKALSRDEDPQLEFNRIYAVVEPTVHEQLSRMLGIDRMLRIPKFFPSKRKADSEESLE